MEPVRRVPHPLFDHLENQEITFKGHSNRADLMPLETNLGIYPEGFEDWVEEYREGSEPDIAGYLSFEQYLEDNNIGTEVESYLSDIGIDTELQLLYVSYEESEISFNNGWEGSIRDNEDSFGGIDIEFYDNPDRDKGLEDNIETVTFRYSYDDPEWLEENLVDQFGVPFPHRGSSNMRKRGGREAVYSLE